MRGPTTPATDRRRVESPDRRENEFWKEWIRAGNLYINRGTTAPSSCASPSAAWESRPRRRDQGRQPALCLPVHGCRGRGGARDGPDRDPHPAPAPRSAGSLCSTPGGSARGRGDAAGGPRDPQLPLPGGSAESAAWSTPSTCAARTTCCATCRSACSSCAAAPGRRPGLFDVVAGDSAAVRATGNRLRERAALDGRPGRRASSAAPRGGRLTARAPVVREARPGAHRRDPLGRPHPRRGAGPRAAGPRSRAAETGFYIARTRLRPGGPHRASAVLPATERLHELPPLRQPRRPRSRI